MDQVEYMARCETRPCGWFGPWRRWRWEAVADANAHHDKLANTDHRLTINEA